MSTLDDAVAAAADALRDQKTPEIWRSFEALAEAAIVAALPYLNVESLVAAHTPNLFS